jgi:hypothetical protein
VNDQAVLYALSTLAQTCAALAAFVGAIGLFRLQTLRDQHREADFEYRARVRMSTGHETHGVPIAHVFDLENLVHPAQREHVEEARRDLQDAAPHVRHTIYALAGFEMWILIVILISLGGLAHARALACWSWASVALWLIAIMTVVITGGALFVWLDVWSWIRYSLRH